MTDTLTYQRICRALSELLMAWRYAEATGTDIWDFAVELDLLRDLGATRTDFRFLLRQHYVRHGVEIGGGHAHRRFRETDELSFYETSAFVLTHSGQQFAADVLGERTPESCCLSVERKPAVTIWRDTPDNGRSVRMQLSRVVPVWDTDRHELRFGERIVKQFRWRAVNQEIVLSAFQEEDWADRIDDPLPPQPDQDPKRRLHDTIKCLNRKQQNNLIRFRGDGTGEGVLWEIVSVKF